MGPSILALPLCRVVTTCYRLRTAVKRRRFVFNSAQHYLGYFAVLETPGHERTYGLRVLRPVEPDCKHSPASLVHLTGQLRTYPGVSGPPRRRRRGCKP
jgi:hypothetical protein